MKNALLSLLKLLASVLDARFGAVFEGARQFVGAIDIPNVDPRWADVLALVNALAEDVRLANDADEDVVLAIRRVAEVRFTRGLRDLGLLNLV